MITLKDALMLLPLAGTIFGGGVAYHKIDVRIAETSQQLRRHVAEQNEISLMQKKWNLEKRLRETPSDEQAQRDLEITNRLLRKNETIQQELEKERN